MLQEGVGQEELLTRLSNFFVLLTALSLASLPLTRHLFRAWRRGAHGPDYTRFIPWGIKELAVFLWAYLLILFLAWQASRLFHFGRTFHVFIQILLVNVFFCLFVLSVLGKLARDPLRRAGVLARNAWRAAGLGGSAYLSFIPLYVLVLLLHAYLLRLLGNPMELQDAVAIFQEEERVAGKIGLGICYVLIAPVTEEFFFRGVAYPILRKHLGVPLGMMVVSGFFALVHGIQVFIPILILGIFLVFLFEYTGSLFAPTAAHLLHNGLTLAMLLVLQAM